MKNNDFDYIASKFNAENINSPKKLSEENIKAKLEKGTSADKIIKFKPNNRRFVKGALSVAAAIALVVVSLTAANHYNESRIEKAPTNTNVEDASSDIRYFNSYDEIDSLMKKKLKKSEKDIFVKNFGAKSTVKSETAESAYDGLGSTGAAPSHSQTYKQVDAVDEADIVKTDGEYIYYLSSGEEEIVISSAKNGKTKRISAIKLKDNSNPLEFFIKDNTLVIISTEENYNRKKEHFSSKTNISTFDIKDKENPKREYDYSQSVHYSSSRMIGNCVYLVSDFSNYAYIKNECIPCATGTDGEFEKIDVKNICAIKDSEDTGYTVIGAMDITNGDKAKKTKAVIGSASNVYCNENNLYIAGQTYDYKSDYLASKCIIVKYSLDKTDIKLVATGKVNGDVKSQYSMDEKDGYFRIATTKHTQNGRDINVLYILDEELDEVGRVNGFAKNEHIEAVKYIGDMAYVITYERTDPLFIIDLSKPKNPEILGEVKISGFSTMLVPINEKTLLGIGYSTEENDFGESINGLKLALFDISNPANPRVIGEKEIEGAESSVQYEPKALVVNSEKNYFALPATFDDYENPGALVFKADNGKIEILRKFVSDKLVTSERCVYIDDDIYVIDTYEEIIDSFEV
ncbi:MAG: beta-propeller domain-containing protein [Eubacterium sp.]|nr:beta-propeller domain-containing protein [Eubacterium sp.]